MRTAGTARRRFALGERGVTSLEFALVGSLFMLLLLGSMEMGRYMVTLAAVRNATAEAVRLATLRGDQNMLAERAPCTNLAGALAGVAAKVPSLVAASLTVTMGGCATNAGATTVNVTVNYPFTFAVTLFGATNRPITETAQAVFF